MRVAAALAVVLLAAGFAVAEHAFSHRVHVVGRVLDADGQPVPGLAVNVTFVNITPSGRCFDVTDERTGPTGDYMVCRHTHALPRDGRVVVRVGDASREVAVDHDLRHATANVRLATPRAARDFEGDLEFGRTVLVVGRAFTLLPAPANEESVVVNATPIGGNLTIELLAAGDVVAAKNGSTDEHGGYAVKLDVETLPPGALARVRMGPDATEVALDPAWRRADANIVRDLRLLHGPGSDAPGSAATPAAAYIAVLALAAACVTCGAESRRRSR